MFTDTSEFSFLNVLCILYVIYSESAFGSQVALRLACFVLVLFPVDGGDVIFMVEWVYFLPGRSHPGKLRM